MKEKLLSEKIFKGYGIEAHPVALADLEFLRHSRNTSKIRDQMCDQAYITSERQQHWYETIKQSSHQAHWTIWCQRVRAGYMNIKGIGPLNQQTQVDVGMYVADSVVRHGLLGFAIGLMQLSIVFDVLCASQIKMRLKESNPNIVQFNARLGYSEDGREDGFIKMSITPEAYRLAKAKLIRYFTGENAIFKEVTL